MCTNEQTRQSKHPYVTDLVKPDLVGHFALSGGISTSLAPAGFLKSPWSILFLPGEQCSFPGKGFLAVAVLSKSPYGSQNSNSSVLKLIVEKEWSSVYIHGLPKRSREEAMRELVTEQLRESQCIICPISHTSKVAVAAFPEELPGQLKKLLTACELRKFFDKRAKVRKVYGSADLLLNPLFVQCPICAAVVSLGHFNDIMIKRDNLWQHTKSSHVDDSVRSRYRGMLGIGVLQCLILVEYLIAMENSIIH